MRYLLLALLLVGCSQSTIPPEVIQVTPEKYDLNDPVFTHARQEVEELVADCGPGVIKGASGENRCAYEVALDETFFRHPAMKTGLLHEKDWQFKDGVTWYSPTVSTLPDKFDLRDLMPAGKPTIKQQQCGDCWAWATHHGLEIARAVHDKVVLDHSVQTILSCSGTGTCNGGYMSTVGFLTRGLPLEPEFPYTGRDSKCKFSQSTLDQGWDGKIIAAPYIGSSLEYSHALGALEARPTVEEMKAAIYQWKSPLVVTVAAYSISGSGVYDSCSAINSGGNHMVAIIGWEKWQGKDVALVWNSWGTGHGENGVSRIVWECGQGKLNRGLGVSARIVQYKPACTPPEPIQTKAHHVILEGSSIKLGKKIQGQRCQWVPTDGLSDPNSCETYATPTMNTEYHVLTSNDCGTISNMVTIEVWGPKGKSKSLKTPTGVIRVSETEEIPKS